VQIGREMSKIPGDGTHLSGPERADRLLDCSSDDDMAYKDNMKSNKPAAAKTKSFTKAEKATSNQSTKNGDK
jgi:hypothetical protein